MARRVRGAPAPSPLALAVHQQVHGKPLPPPTAHAQGGFSLVEVLLGIAVLGVIGAGTWTLHNRMQEKKATRVEQAHVHTLAERVGSAYSAVGRFPDDLLDRAIADGLVPASLIKNGTARNEWGGTVDLMPTTINGRPNAGLEIIYSSVPQNVCAPFAIASGAGMFNVEVGGASVMDANGEVSSLAAGEECAKSASNRVVFTYYSGASGLAVAPPPALCAADPTNPLCAVPPATTPPPAAPPSAPPVAPPPPPPPPGSPPPPPPPPPPPGTPAPPPGTPSSPPPPIAPPPPPGSYCVAPPTLVETPTRLQPCAPGRVTPAGASSFTQTRSRTTTYSCPDPWGAAVPSVGGWSSWSPTEASACALACVAPAPLPETRAGTPQTSGAPGPLSQAGPAIVTNTPQTQTIACEAGQTGSITQTRTMTVTQPTIQTRTGSRTTTQSRTTTYTCPSPTGPASSTTTPWSAPGAPYGAWTYSGWSSPSPSGAATTTYTPWTTTSNTCTPTGCSPGQTQTEVWDLPRPAVSVNVCYWGTPPAATGSSLYGSGWTKMSRSRTCASPGTWGPWTIYGPPTPSGPNPWVWTGHTSAPADPNLGGFLINGCLASQGCSGGSGGVSTRWVTASKTCSDGSTMTWEQQQIRQSTICSGGSWIANPNAQWYDLAFRYGSAAGSAGVRNIVNACP